MALLSHFYLSTPGEAAKYDAEPMAFDGVRYPFERITDVELSILWSILRDEEWDTDLLDHFEMVFEVESGDRLIISVPQEMLDALAALPEDLVQEAAEVWAETEELDADPAEIRPIVDALITLGRKAKADGKQVYLWIQA